MNYRVNRSDESMSDGMALFTLPPTDVSCESRETWHYTSKNQIDDNIMLFVIDVPPGFMVKTDEIQLCMKGKVVQGNGSAVPAMPATDYSKAAITAAETAALKAADVFPCNLLQSSMFQRVTIRIQDKTVDVCEYPYQAFVDVMFDASPQGTMTREMMRGVFGQSSLKDDVSINKTSDAYDSRARFLSLKTTESQEFEMRGPIWADILKQERPLLGNIRIIIELERNRSERIMNSIKPSADFRFQVTDSRLQVPVMRLRADINAANEAVLKNTQALYPYEKCCVKKFYVASGRYSFEVEDMHQGSVASEITVFMVPSANYNGNYAKDFLRLSNGKVKSIGFKIDNLPTPGPAMKLKYEADARASFLGDAVEAIVKSKPDSAWNSNHQFELPFFHFNLRNTNNRNVLPLVRKGLTKLEMTFASPLTENVILFVLAKFPAVLQVDAERNVTLV